MMSEGHLSCAGVAQLGEQQTEARSILEVPCSIHGPGIFYRSSLDVNFFASIVCSQGTYSISSFICPHPESKILVVSRTQ